MSEGVITRRPDVIVHTLPDDTQALADPDRGIMLILNPVGAAVWALLAEEPRVDAIVALLSEALDTPRVRVAEDVEAFLVELRGHGFVT